MVKKLIFAVMLVATMLFVLVGCETVDESEYTLTINVENEAGGSVDSPESGDVFDHGATAKIEVTINDGYKLSWGGPDGDDVGGPDDDGDYIIEMDSSKEITALFEEVVASEPETLIEINQYELKADPNGGDAIENGVSVETLAGPEGDDIEVLSVSADSGNTLEALYADDELADFSKYTSITFYVKADADVELDPLVQNADWNFHKAPTEAVTGDGEWHEVTVDPATYGEAYSNGSDLDLTAIKKIGFEVKSDIDFYITNPVGNL